ncbi:MFS family permease [Rhizomicrobium palustre]|uniref:MFS family permease n=1 Tax=Rhizomicrobium palustre TaxID=189966 RepID=A0A846MW62_9PROT|nr:MFS transporter [Rhizomicrobium palustre]NIK87280.1 MFS family permease [Rhizomicrobium palustre]
MSTASKTHPVWFLVMFIPMGISNGYVVVTLAYLLATAGVGAVGVAALGAWSLLPQTWKVLGGPLVDTTLSNKTWFVGSAIATGILMIAASLIAPSAANYNLIAVLAFLFSTAAAFNALAADSIMAYATVPEEKGRAGGWSQAGNLGGSGLGGGLGLWLSQNATPSGTAGVGDWLTAHTGLHAFADLGLWFGQHVSAGAFAGIAVGLVCLLSCLGLFFVHEPEGHHRAESFGESIINVGKDAWALVCSRKGLLAVVVFALPVGVGAMTQLWSGVAADWHASANWVALVNGALGGVLSMVGCIAGGWLCDKMDRMTALNLFSIATAACALVMALAAKTETNFIIFVCLYMILTGFCYAAFGAVVLEAIGQGAAATKYNLLASLANVPIIYLSILDGKAHDHWGAKGMLLADALIPVAGTVLFVLFAIATRRFYKQKSLDAS